MSGVLQPHSNSVNLQRRSRPYGAAAGSSSVLQGCEVELDACDSHNQLLADLLTSVEPSASMLTALNEQVSLQWHCHLCLAATAKPVSC